MPRWKALSRRSFVGILGGGVVAASASRDAVTRLLHPLWIGSRFGRWTIAEVAPLKHGAITIKARTDHGETFTLEILARDPGALAQKPPATTARHAIFLPNGGNGWSPTHEEHGLAAMALAQVIAKNEDAAPLAGLLTHAQRIQVFST